MNLPYAALTLDPRTNQARPYSPYEIIGKVPNPNNPGELLDFRVSGASNPDGYFLESVPIGGVGTVRLYGATGFSDVTYPKTFTDQHGVTDTLLLVPSGAPVGPVERVYADGLGYRTASGKTWRGYSMTGFRDYQRFLVGEDIRPLLEQARSLGANMRRIFGMWGLDFQTNDNFGPFLPQRYPDYYAKIPAFCALLAEYGMWVEFTVFADTAYVMPNPDEQMAHFDRVCAKLRECPNTFVELVNENNQHGNHVDIERFTKPSGIAACSGSNGEGGNPPLPCWDYSNLHAERREERLPLTTSTVWHAINGYKEGADVWPGTQQVTNNDEPGRTRNPFTAYQMGIGSGYGGWILSHTRGGTQSVLLDDVEANCTRQMFRGAQGLEYQP